jgi:hypothetical protein
MICDSCHKDKPDVRETVDQYASDINNETVEVNLCDDCYQDRCDDI